MSSQTDVREELRFFGKVSASVSHEIKNVFAVINEGAGLLDDLAMMAEKGAPVTPDKLRYVTRSILGQVGRGDRIVRNMNAFAHSVDQDVQTVEVDSAVRLMVELTKRLAGMKNVTLEALESEPVSLRTSPYGLERLLYSAVMAGLEGASSTMTVGVRAENDGATLSLYGGNWSDEALSSTDFVPLADALGARTELSDDGASLTILLSGLQ